MNIAITYIDRVLESACNPNTTPQPPVEDGWSLSQIESIEINLRNELAVTTKAVGEGKAKRLRAKARLIEGDKSFSDEKFFQLEQEASINGNKHQALSRALGTVMRQKRKLMGVPELGMDKNRSFVHVAQEFLPEELMKTLWRKTIDFMEKERQKEFIKIEHEQPKPKQE